MSGAKTPPETPVAATLAARIAQHGPLPLDEVMAVAADAYYAQGDVFGRGGDFITAPEISQVFGELVGLWCAATWQQLGAPLPFHLVECGPGRGTLMADALRAASKVPGFLNAAEIHLVERSAALRERQKSALASYRVQWHDAVTDIPGGPMLLVAERIPRRATAQEANSVRTQRMAGPNAMSRIRRTRLRIHRASRHSPPKSGRTNGCGKIGAIVVDAPGRSRRLCADIGSAHVVQDSGAALLIDYGYSGPATGDTLQAVKAHRFHPVLADLGGADLTAHVDFTAVRRAAEAAGARALRGRSRKAPGSPVSASACVRPSSVVANRRRKPRRSPPASNASPRRTAWVCCSR